jgi:hypothetical protein
MREESKKPSVEESQRVLVVNPKGSKLPVVEGRASDRPVKLVDKVHEQDRVLLVKLPHREPSNLLRQTNLILSNWTTGSRVSILAGPKKRHDASSQSRQPHHGGKRKEHIK